MTNGSICVYELWVQCQNSKPCLFESYNRKILSHEPCPGRPKPYPHESGEGDAFVEEVRELDLFGCCSREGRRRSSVGEKAKGGWSLLVCCCCRKKASRKGDRDLRAVQRKEKERKINSIVQQGLRHWSDVKGRIPSSVLTCLLKSNHPSLVRCRGKMVVASTWKHYQAAKDTNGKSIAEIVEEGFWLRFRFDPAKEAESRDHVGVCCSSLLSSMLYYARIYSTIAHFRNVEGRKICDKIAGQFYLTREEYIAQHQVWCKQDCWDAMATKWSSPRFKNRSEINSGNRSSPRYKTHKGGSSSIAVIRQRLSKKLGRQVTDVEAWVHTHRGSNPEDITSLNTEEATTCLEKYKTKAMELIGPNFDWLRSPVDIRALYQCSCGRQHDKWATFNGIINDKEARAELKRSRTSLAAAKRQRQEEEQHMRKEAQESHMAKQYAENMLQWGATVQAHYEQLQRFMETLALHNGIPVAVVPPPLPLPPQHPTYVISLSPNPLAGNAGTFGSSIRAETPDDILTRIAYRGFRVQVNATDAGRNGSSPLNAATSNSGGNAGSGGLVNATTSGGGNYSPQYDDDFPID